MMSGQNQMFRALIVGVKNELFILDCRINISPYWIFIYVSLGISLRIPASLSPGLSCKPARGETRTWMDLGSSTG